MNGAEDWEDGRDWGYVRGRPMGQADRLKQEAQVWSLSGCLEGSFLSWARCRRVSLGSSGPELR
jgi:hypothetical protein